VGGEESPALVEVLLEVCARLRRLRGGVLAAFAREDHDVVGLELGGVVPEHAGRGGARVDLRAVLIFAHRPFRILALVDVHAAGTARVRHLGLDAELAHEALERIGTTGGDRDLRNVAFRLGARQTRGTDTKPGVGALVHGAGRDGDLAPPATNLHDDRNVDADGHVLQRAVTLRVGQRRGDR